MACYGWSSGTLGSYEKMVKEAQDDILTLIGKLKVDALVFCGSSGAAIAFPLAYLLNMPIIMVRKEGEKSHGDKVEYLLQRCDPSLTTIKNYLIVDDFVSNGDTLSHIYTQMKKHSAHKSSKCVGVYEYDENCVSGNSRHEIYPNGFSKRAKTIKSYLRGNIKE